MAGGPIEDGAVAIRGERIADVGRFREVRARNTAEVIDLGGSVLLPGLINTHCHLDYTMLRGRIARQPSFTDWIRTINSHKAGFSTDDYIAAIDAGFREARRFGTTTILNLTACPQAATRAADVLRTFWCAELIDVRPNSDPHEITDAACDALAHLASPLAGRGLAPHAPYTASAELYRHVGRIASHEDFVRTTHVAESFEELQMFRHASGALYDFLAELGRDMSDCGNETAFARLLRLCSDKSRWIFAHANELTDDDFQLLRRADPLHIVHCPRSHGYFRHTRFAYERLRDAGVNVCIGTDSLASAPDLSLLAELRIFARERPHVSARELLEMVTTNAAAALRRQGELGRLLPGYLADIVAVPFQGKPLEAYEGVVAHEGAISFVMLNGEPQQVQ